VSFIDDDLPPNQELENKAVIILNNKSQALQLKPSPLEVLEVSEIKPAPLNVLILHALHYAYV
jgi:hypothetical protein